ncbi:MAG: sulfatase-like hydrolase/transferase [Planctomycetes bacterium]|nr:sulfatase-like hydrolase/transferase [Planctomycetota bacterium]MCH9779316.1 sulfatase-like hydrolase/transferase [Planctomycetota bacterium]MCH9791672.1 sulfatase-like hydrolase/transferase [Planctomycetota bacterium]
MPFVQYALAFILTLFLTTELSAAEAVEQTKAKKRPNIMVVLCDDLGYGDLACYGHPVIKSPHIDRFAKEGLKLTSCYSAHPNCSPSRAGLMTGRTPFRVGVYNWIPMHSPMHVRKQEITIATLLRQAGYATCHAGKWHLNGMFNLVGQPQPSDHGFDHWFSTQNNALPTHENPFNFVRNGKPVGRQEGYAAQLVADEAQRWLIDLRDKEKPFFMFVCFHEPHEPIASAERFRKLYPAPQDSTLPAHHGNVTQMDDAFGRILKTLDDQKLRDNTLVIFTSDNGPAITRRHPHGSSGPLRDKKGATFEGGIRVPGIVQWPAHVKPGTTSDIPVSGLDILPTLCAVADIPVPSDRVLDGTNVLPVFKGKSLKRTKPLYWQFNRARNAAKVAIRDGEWKLLARLDVPSLKPSGGITKQEIDHVKQAKLAEFELYHIQSDIAETTDRSESEPKRFEQMKKQMQEIFEEVQAEAPRWPAWEFARYEGKILSEYYRKQAEAKKQQDK